MLVKIINGLIDVVVDLFNFLLLLLPNTPFQFSAIQWGVFGQLIGLVFPISEMLWHLLFILSAFSSYYTVRWLLRLIRQIQ